ncbi:site-specific integrase [Saccharopolyspora gloriosae]|uniref:Integrase n=1 Tax=Saccharopolyspora gloriosae TaxID=455344 RepID=A0A840N5T8_9PSEU|nr:site-specific integrase [Saccharopolyspora gloriosae]MBB5067386.1 integrase [Saccharopolyspora gloriosae]
MASIRKLANGKWQAQFRPIPGGKQITRTTRRKIDAQQWLDEQTAAMKMGQFVDPTSGRVTFSEFFEDWAKRQLWASGTERAMRLATKSVPFADVPMSRILRSHIELWVKNMQTEQTGYGRKEGLAPGTIKTRFNNVRSVFRAAARDRVIASDPSEGVRLPRVRRGEMALNIPTPKMVKSIIQEADPGFGKFVKLCAFAGLRLGEAAALRVIDFDFEARTVSITRQVQRQNGRTVEILPPKHGSERIVFLADSLNAELREYVDALPGVGGDRWLFKGEAAYPLHQNSIGYLWRKARSAAGCEQVRLHDLRHFYASGLIASGCDVVTVQRALGHSSANITLSTYAHLWPTAEDRTRSAAAGLLRDALGSADEPLTNKEGEDGSEQQ